MLYVTILGNNSARYTGNVCRATGKLSTTKIDVVCAYNTVRVCIGVLADLILL